MVVPNDEVVARAPQSIEREASSFPAVYMKKKYCLIHRVLVELFVSIIDTIQQILIKLFLMKKQSLQQLRNTKIFQTKRKYLTNKKYLIRTTSAYDLQLILFRLDQHKLAARSLRVNQMIFRSGQGLAGADCFCLISLFLVFCWL